MKPITGAEELEITGEMCMEGNMMSVVMRAMRVVQYDGPTMVGGEGILSIYDDMLELVPP